MLREAFLLCQRPRGRPGLRFLGLRKAREIPLIELETLTTRMEANESNRTQPAPPLLECSL
jgi:hypothetical protein